MKSFALISSLLLLAGSCDGINICTPTKPCDCYTIEDQNLVFKKCNPEPSPIPSPSTPNPSPSISPEPSPSIIPTPTPIPSIPPAEDCSVYNSYRTKWSLLTCVDGNNKQICGKPLDKTCGCNGDGCSFNMPKNSSCNGDSTPIYFGEVSCWKTGNVEPCEYPPGSKCGAKSVWTSDSGVIIIPDSGGYGAKLKFPSNGSFKIKACRAGSNTLCTQKTAKVN